MQVRIKCFAIALLIAVIGMPVSSLGQSKRIRVAAASDLQEVMPRIAKAFQDQAHIAVDDLYGSSGNFFAQIQNGAPFDVFFSADREFPEKLIQANLAEPRSATVYALGRLVLWMPAKAECAPEVEKWNCLLQPSVAKIAIANPAHAPYGRAAIEALQSGNIYSQVRAKLVMGENIAQAAQFAESGNAQAGILAYSQMASPGLRDGKRWEIPKDAYPPIEQTVVVLKAAKEKAAAEDFVKFVTDGPGRAMLTQFGFQLPLPPPVERHK